MISKDIKNQTMEAVQESGLDPILFNAEEIETKKGDRYFVIQLRDSPLLFKISQKIAFDLVEFNYSQNRPGYPLLDREKTYALFSLKEEFTAWLNIIVKPYIKDLNDVDLWQEFSDKSKIIETNLKASDEFEQFSDDQKVPIRIKINEFRLLIERNYNPSDEQLKTINERLDYLSSALDNHNKFDWKGIAINTALSIVVALSLSHEQGRQLLQLFVKIFSNLIHFLS